MQGNTPGQGGSNNKPSGLSWTTPSSSNATSPLLGSAKPAAPAAKAAPSTPKPRASGGEAQKRKGNTAGWFVGGVIVGALLIWGWYGLNPSAPSAATSSSGANGNEQSGIVGNTAVSASSGSAVGSAAAPSAGGANAISVASPQDAGMDVVITSANVTAPTWVVVYELAGNKPARALGATLFFPEYNGKGGVVSLLRATQPGTTYFVGQATDDGDHIFTLHKDKDVTDISGNLAGVTFKTK